MTTDSKWSYTDSPVRVASVKLACGHTIEASEYDGGMDELPIISQSMLEATVSRRVVTHAIGGCDEPVQAGVLHHRHTVTGPDLLSLAAMLKPAEMDTLLDLHAQHLADELTDVLRRHGWFQADPEPRPDPRTHPTLETR